MAESGAPTNGDPMRYAVGGGDVPTTAQALEKYTGEVGWAYLKPHFVAGSMYYVDPCLRLAEVGEAIANDDRPQVERWLKSGDLLRPGELHARHWEDTGQQFVALVVSPFVLAQPAATADG